MPLRRLSCLVGLVILLSACTTPRAVAPTVAPMIATNPLAAATPASAVAKMVTETPTGTAAPSQAQAAPTQAATAYPAPATAGVATAAPPVLLGTAYPAGATLTPQAALPAVKVEEAATAPFKDCARTPGLVGCDPKAAPLAGHLAFADRAANRVVALDLQTGQGWQADLQPNWLSWSPDGKSLLVAWADHYSVFSASGVPGQAVSLPPGSMTEPGWTGDSHLSLEGAVAAADGTQARLEYTPEMTWLLHVKPAQGSETVIGLEPQPTDRLYQIDTWVPGEKKLLVQRYYASNSAMLVGGEVLEVDTTAQTVKTLNITAPLGEGAAFTWQPGAPRLLAFIASGFQIMGERRLALLDAKTNAVRYPLPEGVDVTGLAWRPDGKGLAFSAVPAETASAEARKTVPGPGIYQLDPLSGAVTALVAAPEGATDAWPHWTADGKALVYARTITPSAGGATVQIRALSGGQDWVLVDGLPAQDDLLGAAAWRMLVAFGQ